MIFREFLENLQHLLVVYHAELDKNSEGYTSERAEALNTLFTRLTASEAQKNPACLKLMKLCSQLLYDISATFKVRHLSEAFEAYGIEDQHCRLVSDLYISCSKFITQETGIADLMKFATGKRPNDFSVSKKILLAMHSKVPLYNQTVLNIYFKSKKYAHSGSKIMISNLFNRYRDDIDALQNPDEASFKFFDERFIFEYGVPITADSLIKISAYLDRCKAALVRKYKTSDNPDKNAGSTSYQHYAFFLDELLTHIQTVQTLMQMKKFYRMNDLFNDLIDVCTYAHKGYQAIQDSSTAISENMISERLATNIVISSMVYYMQCLLAPDEETEVEGEQADIPQEEIISILYDMLVNRRCNDATINIHLMVNDVLKCVMEGAYINDYKKEDLVKNDSLNDILIRQSIITPSPTCPIDPKSKPFAEMNKSYALRDLLHDLTDHCHTGFIAYQAMRKGNTDITEENITMHLNNNPIIASLIFYINSLRAKGEETEIPQKVAVLILYRVLTRGHHGESDIDSAIVSDVLRMLQESEHLNAYKLEEKKGAGLGPFLRY